jgi:radical SAM superfamily enzyme YgiQ (UPF0313 family)
MRILLVAYDNDSYIHWFPQGLAAIAAVLHKEGYEVAIYNQDKFHYPDEHLTEYLNNNKFDVIGIGVIAGYYQYRKLLKIADAVNKSKNRPFFIIGGHGPSPDPAFFLKKTQADAVIIGEGELTIIDLMGALAKKQSLYGVMGIAFADGNKVIISERRPLIQDIDKDVPLPAYDLFPIDYYKLIRMPYAANNDFVLPVLSGRGCTFECSFCYRMDKGFRPRSNESIIEEIKFLKRNYGITYIIFSDELLMSSVMRTVSLCEDFIKAKVGIKWCCNGRLNYANTDVLKVMKEAGCVFINYGIEAMDDDVLKKMNKALTTRQIIKGIEATLAAGISPGFNIIFGNVGDNRETLNKGIEFLLKYDDMAQMRTIRPVTPYPGSPLFDYALEKGLLRDTEDFYENKHINSDLLAVNFTDLTDNDFHQCLLDANTRLITNYFQKRLSAVIEQAKKLYMERDVTFRGFRDI